MGNEGIFRGSLAVIFALLILIRLSYSRTGRNGEAASAKRENGTDVALLKAINALAAVATLVYLVAPRLVSRAALPLPIWLRRVGGLLGLITVALFFRVHHALGGNWSVSAGTTGQHTLVTAGPYRRIRHPMYSTLFVWALAFFLLSANWLVGGTWLALGLVAASRAGREEAALLERFGAEYRAYMRRTGRFLPRLRR